MDNFHLPNIVLTLCWYCGPSNIRHDSRTPYRTVTCRTPKFRNPFFPPPQWGSIVCCCLSEKDSCKKKDDDCRRCLATCRQLTAFVFYWLSTRIEGFSRTGRYSLAASYSHSLLFILPPKQFVLLSCYRTVQAVTTTSTPSESNKTPGYIATCLWRMMFVAIWHDNTLE